MSNYSNVLPVSWSNAPFPNFAKPSEVGFYSTDNENQIFFDKRQLSIFSAPPNNLNSPNFDLNEGYAKLVEQRHRYPGCLDNLLRWIIEEKEKRLRNKEKTEFSADKMEKISLKEIITGADFVCWRGIFTILAASPYEKQENWLLGVVRFQNILFMVQFETEEKKEKNARMTEREKYMTYWGHRFEKYVTKSTTASTASDDSEEKKNSIVDCNEQFCVVFRTKIVPLQESSSTKHFRLLYGAEIDCVDEENRYVELKTSRVIDGWRQDQNFRKFKLLKWWLQSFLAGIDRVICGHRDDSGLVKYLKNYEVAEMSRSANSDGFWKPANCFNFLYDLLIFVDKNVATAEEDCLSEITVFEFRPQERHVRLVRNHDFKSSDVVPDWFVSAFGKV